MNKNFTSAPNRLDDRGYEITGATNPTGAWFQFHRPLVVRPMKSVTHGQCDARPTVTFPDAERHHSQPIDRYQIMLLRDRCTKVWTICQALLHIQTPTGSRPLDRFATSNNHFGSRNFCIYAPINWNPWNYINKSFLLPDLMQAVNLQFTIYSLRAQKLVHIIKNFCTIKITFHKNKKQKVLICVFSGLITNNANTSLTFNLLWP